MKVLIVDDDPNLRELYSRTITAAGDEARAAADAQAAISALSGEEFDVLLLDLRLGPDHGREVAREVARLGLSTRIVLVGGTGAATRDELFDVAPSVAAVLRKPVDIEALMDTLAIAGAGDIDEVRLAGRRV